MRTLRVLEHFTCLARDCPAHCCGRWAIVADPEIEARWRELAERTGDHTPLDSITSVDVEGRSRRMLTKGDDENCVHLQPDGLCSIQAKYGHEYLPETCRSYPRMTVSGKAMQIKTAELSCPEIARQVLNADPAEALFAEDAASIDAFSTGLFSAETTVSAALDELTNAVLPQARFPLNLRIYYLAKTVADLAYRSEQGTLDEQTLWNLCKAPRQGLYDANLALKSGHLKVGAVSDEFWRLIAGLAIEVGVMDLAGTQASVTTLRDAVADGAAAEIHRQIVELRALARSELLTRFGAGLQNYLTASLMNRGFPWRPAEGNFVATFMNAVLPFAVVQLLCWLRSADEVLDEGVLLEFIYTTERRFSHADLVYKILSRSPVLLDFHRAPHIYLEVC